MLLSPQDSSLLATLILIVGSQQVVYAFSGSEYALDTEYSGANFFDGWDFFTGKDPTDGFVTYYSHSSSQLADLINATDAGPAYMGVDYVNKLPITSSGYADGAGRPSVRISSKMSWTHGLFIGDFNHAPSGICGTWPAFWTLGPNWPSTGEIDIMESVNKVATNAVSLHTNETCLITGNSSTQTGVLGNTNCAYYPDYNVGCGVVDTRPASYSQFNSVGGGVYAMQWTSEYIRVWFFPRDNIPRDVVNKEPDPSSWGLPMANMMGDCVFDQHFRQHKIIFDTTFCGGYAGNPYVWNSTVNSCAIATDYSTCDAYVAERPDVFRDAYWSVNYVRVYQLVNPDSPVQEPQYIASLQPANSANAISQSSTAPPIPTASLCPKYNFTTIQNGGLTYEVECAYDLPGPDIPPPYPNFQMHTLEDCVAGCTFWNTVNGTNLCGGVSYDSSVPFCYFKKSIDSQPQYKEGFAGARLIYYGYPQITDDPRSQSATSTSMLIDTIPPPQYYRPQTTSPTSSTTSRLTSTTSISLNTQVPPPLGIPTNTTSGPSIGPGTPTVSFSGNESVPIIVSTTVRSNTTTILISNTTTTSSSTLLMLSTSLSNTIRTTTVTTSPSVSTSSSILSSTIPVTASSAIGSTTSESLTRPSIKSSISISVVDEATATATTTVLQGSSIIMDELPGPAIISGFKYLGCKRSLYGRNVFVLSESSANMTLERCIDTCSQSYYAALSDSKCYCINTPLSDNQLVIYRDSYCNTSCPGNSNEKCGGSNLSDRNTTMQDLPGSNATDPTLLTLYMNMRLVDPNSISITSQSSTTTQTMTLLPVVHSSTLPASSQIYYATVTNTMTVTQVAATWWDYCHTCPGYTVILTTTITVPCPVALSGSEKPYQILTVPMMTTSRQCQCGPNGALSIMTVTIPHETEIALLANAASQVLAEMSGGTTSCSLTSARVTLDQSETIEGPTVSAGIGAAWTTAISAWPTAVGNSSNLTLPTLSQSIKASQILPKAFTGGAGRAVWQFMGVMLCLLTGAVMCLMP